RDALRLGQGLGRFTPDAGRRQHSQHPEAGEPGAARHLVLAARHPRGGREKGQGMSPDTNPVDPGLPLDPLPGHSSRGRLERILRRGEFAVTAELNPPDSADPEDVYNRAIIFDGWVDGINAVDASGANRSEEHTYELQSRENLVCRLLLEKKN